jgi:hypothetical protein
MTIQMFVRDTDPNIARIGQVDLVGAVHVPDCVVGKIRPRLDPADLADAAGAYQLAREAELWGRALLAASGGRHAADCSAPRPPADVPARTAEPQPQR